MDITFLRELLFSTLVLFGFLSPSHNRQQSYFIHGTVTGNNPVKNAILFDKDLRIIGKSAIKNSAFNFSGNLASSDDNTDLPAYFLLCTNDETVSKGDFGIAKLIYLDPEVEVQFHSGNLKYEVTRGAMNALEAEFDRIENYYRTTGRALQKEVGRKTDEEYITYVYTRHLRLLDSAHIELIRKNPSSPVVLGRLSGLINAGTVSLSTVRDAFNGLAPALKMSPAGKKTDADIRLHENSYGPMYKFPPRLSIGTEMFDFSLPDAQGKVHNGKSLFAGRKFTILDFWSTYCVPCIHEMPNVIEVQKAYRHLGFGVVTVSIDKTKNYRRWLGMIRGYQMDSLINVIDTGNVLADKLQIKEIPANYLVDSTGVVIGRNLSGIRLARTLDSLLKK